MIFRLLDRFLAGDTKQLVIVLDGFFAMSGLPSGAWQHLLEMESANEPTPDHVAAGR